MNLQFTKESTFCSHRLQKLDISICTLEMCFGGKGKGIEVWSIFLCKLFVLLTILFLEIKIRQ